jgi:hypothetical protein
LGLRSGLVLLGQDPLTSARAVLDSDRGSDVQPHRLPEGLVEPLGFGIQESLDEGHEAGEAAPCLSV